MTLTKITARIDQALWDGFSEQMDALFIKKGAFLDFVIRTELPHLERDLAGVTLSTKAKRYIANKLGAICGFRSVTLNSAAPASTA